MGWFDGIADGADGVSAAMQRYAADIYRLQQDQPHVSLSDLADRMNVSVQAASRMVRRLKEAGLVEHEPYRGVRLTSEGERSRTTGTYAGIPAGRRNYGTVLVFARSRSEFACRHQ